MSASSPALLDAAARTLVLRHVRTLITSTLAFFGQRQSEHLKSMRAHLFELFDARPGMTQAQNLRTAGMMLDNQADLFNRSFQAALKESIEEDLESVLPGALLELRPLASGDSADGPVSMALLDVDEIERHLLVDRVAQRFNQRYDAKLGPFTQSLGVLLRIPDMSLADNPFRPATFIRAFSIAWQKAEFDPEAAEDFVLALEPQHGIDWTPLYAALTEMLVRAGFSAQPVHRIKRAAGSESVAAPLQAGATEKSGFGAIEQGAPRSGFANLAPATTGDGGSGVADGPGIAARARQFLQKLGFGRKPSGLAQPGGSAAASAGSGGSGGASGNGSGFAGGGGSSDGSGGSGGMGDGRDGPTSHVPADSAFMGYLGGLQARAESASIPPWVEGQDIHEQNLLRQMRHREEFRRAPELDRGTVDALAEVFDYVFADRAIPMQLKIVIGRLQIPVLKAAMIDRDFFLTPEHPARKLIDALAAASVAWIPDRGEDDPLYLRIEATVRRVLTEFDDDLNLFGVLLAQFNTFLLETEQRAQVQIEPAADLEQKNEALEMALAHADEVIHQCIGGLPPTEPLQPFLLPFLAHQWREVMARAWLKTAETPADWDHALRTMDQVIWSVQPKAGAEERAKLVALLPDLVRNLNGSLDAIHWDGEERASFTRLLIATHMKAIRGTRSASAQPDSGPGELEVKAGRDALKALDDRRARPALIADGFEQAAQALARGQWFDFVDDKGAVRHYRLAWVSPQRTRLLFTNRDGFEAFVRSEREVAGLLREGRLAAINQEPIVSRAIDQIMAQTDQVDIDLEIA
jgi:uncharacterized membrane protein YgcG